MSLILLNLQSRQQIELCSDSPFIIGRGTITGCTDKRVSRSHGKITCTVDGKIHLVALHTNPCFFTRNGMPPVLQLNKNDEETLNEGDCLGLLPNAFWFQITSNKKKNGEKEVKEPDKSTDEPAVGEPATPPTKKNKCSTLNTENDKSEKSHTSNSTETNNSEVLQVKIDNPDTSTNLEKESNSLEMQNLEKTRRLPLWMYEIDDVTENNTCLNKRPSPFDAMMANKRTKHSDEESFKNQSDNVSNINSTVENEISALGSSTTSDPALHNLSDTETINNEPEIIEAEPSEGGEFSKTKPKKDGYESDVNIEIVIPPGSITGRKVCMYADNCYRQNSHHRLKFCHPGDVDFVPYEDRPLCQYGATCYRRNPIHMVEYKHPNIDSTTCISISPSSSSINSTASSLPLSRRRRPPNLLNADDFEDEEYDFEDPFVNDESSDDYLPSELMSEEDESDLYHDGD